MEKHEIVNKVVEAITQVQEASGRPSSGIGASMRPMQDVEGFDSMSGMEATVVLLDSLGIDLPEDCNPFISTGGKRELSIEEIAETLRTYMQSEEIAND